jgi:hypothetical protein
MNLLRGLIETFPRICERIREIVENSLVEFQPEPQRCNNQQWRESSEAVARNRVSVGLRI